MNSAEHEDRSLWPWAVLGAGAMVGIGVAAWVAAVRRGATPEALLKACEDAAKELERRLADLDPAAA